MDTFRTYSFYFILFYFICFICFHSIPFLFFLFRVCPCAGLFCFHGLPLHTSLAVYGGDIACHMEMCLSSRQIFGWCVSKTFAPSPFVQQVSTRRQTRMPA